MFPRLGNDPLASQLSETAHGPRLAAGISNEDGVGNEVICSCYLHQIPARLIVIIIIDCRKDVFAVIFSRLQVGSSSRWLRCVV